MYLHTIYETATIDNIGDLLWVIFFQDLTPEIKVTVAETVSDIPWPQHISTNWILGLICHIIWDMFCLLSVSCLVGELFCLHTTVMLTVCYINRQPGRGYHYSETHAWDEIAASIYVQGIVHCTFGIKVSTYIGLPSFLWDVGKQCRTRTDTAKLGVWSGSALFALIPYF